MKKPLHDVMFASEKRKKTLLLLKDGSKEMGVILQSLNTTREALLPQIRILENSYLIQYIDRDAYELTTIGKILIDKITPFIDTLEVLDNDIDYWGQHDLDFIPPHLLKRLHELELCTVMTNIPSTEVWEPSKIVLEKSRESKYQCSVTTFLFPHFPSMLADFNKRGVNMLLVVSEELLVKIKQEMDDGFRNLLISEPNQVYVYPHKMGFTSFGHNDFCFMMRLLTKTGDYDQKYVVAHRPSALEWAKELFEYYLKQSTRVIDL
ncbi:helix-turn-helix transcriptional regulator [Methanomethylovorans sp.]|uniref:helix-turn-helix transcriptional regulator n=1 Tax=Methanomethylovorans sp. TaxID=2758717 RepID=UPI00351CAEA1